MSDFLTAVKTVPLRESLKPAIVGVVSSPDENLEPPQRSQTSIKSPEEALQLLKARSDQYILTDVLQYLHQAQDQSFNIRVPGATSAKITNELVNTTVQDLWGSDDEIRKLLVRCLKSVAGVGAVTTRLKLLLSKLQNQKRTTTSSNATQPLRDTLSVLAHVLDGDKFVQDVWSDVSNLVPREAQRRLLWKEFVSSIGSGKIVALTAQAEDALKDVNVTFSASWLASGSSYSSWLGRNVATMARTVSQADEAAWKDIAQLFGKGLSIGYPGRIIEAIHDNLTLSEDAAMSPIQALVAHLHGHEQRQLLECTFKFISERCMKLQNTSSSPESVGKQTSHLRSAVALLSVLVKGNEPMADRLVAWLTDPVVNSREPFAIRRVALAVIAGDEDRLQDVLEKSMQTFGEHLFIVHTPILQQEAIAQVLLIASGYVHRAQPMSLFMLVRSSTHLNAVSSRLNASSSRARFLGMVVGMALSDLIDKPGQRMEFDLEEAKTQEAQWYRALTRISDNVAVGDFEEMRATFARKSSRLEPQTTQSLLGKNQRKKAATKEIKRAPVKSQTEVVGPRVVEILDGSDEEDDLVPYDKPDEDPEDEDEDPTLVNRNKPRAPVYIRDLIAGLNDKENYERHHLALTHAAPLLRRKSSFGKEVSDHAIELSSILANLGDSFEIDNFIELRLQALIAVLLSGPAEMAPWFARQVFDGDYSLSQRATLLSVLGLGARELAGFKDEDDLNPAPQSTDFPSKKLPERLHKLYAQEKTPLQGITQRLEQSMIQPMALQAADSVSGPNVLKVRTFSSRMDVEKKRKKAVPNALAKVVADSFFFPLTGRWWANMNAYGANNVHFQPFLLTTYIKTLALLLHAAGPGTLSLPQMTGEFWDLLLSVRTNALGDAGVLEAALFAFMTLLEVNEDKRRIAEEHSRQLMETQEWVDIVFEKTAGGDEESERVRMLAAGVLLKTKDVVEKYQRLLVGDMLDY